MHFLVFSDDFGEHPSSCQHLFRHIAKEHRVLWVNTIGMRTPRLNKTDVHKAARKLGKMVKSRANNSKSGREDPNISVVQPFMLPYAHLSVIRKFNKRSVIKRVQKELKRLDMKSPILVTTVPNACDYVGAFDEQRVAYYCVDDFAHWPGHDTGYISRLEDELIAKSDVLVATSQKLYDRLSQTGKPTHMLTHGVDVQHFSNLPDKEHPVLEDIPRPRVGYFGLVDERTDQDLIRAVAQELPDVFFVLTGKVETDVSLLTKLPNVYFTGPVSYTDLPAVLAGWDLCMLPYKVDEFSENINPLKLKEYLAARKQAVCTPLPSAVNLKGYVKICSGRQEFVESIKKVLNEKKNKKSSENNRELKTFIQSVDWSVKAKQFKVCCLLARTLVLYFTFFV